MPGLARDLFVSVGGEPILRDAVEPQTQHGLFVGRKAPVAFGHLWHLDSHGTWAQGWVLSQVSQAAAPWQPNSPTITTEELEEPLSGEPGTALGLLFGLQLVAAVESQGQEPLALTQPLFRAGWAALVEFLNISVAELLPYQGG